MVKAADTSGRSVADRDLAIRQIVNGAVASTEIVDILAAARRSCKREDSVPRRGVGTPTLGEVRV